MKLQKHKIHLVDGKSGYGAGVGVVMPLAGGQWLERLDGGRQTSPLNFSRYEENMFFSFSSCDYLVYPSI